MHDSLSQSVSTPHSTPSLTKFPFWSILHLPFFSIHRGEERQQHGIVPAFKQDGVAFHFCPVTPAGSGSRDLVGGMGFVGPFHVHLADTPIDKKIRRKPFWCWSLTKWRTISMGVKQNVSGGHWLFVRGNYLLLDWRQFAATQNCKKVQQRELHTWSIRGFKVRCQPCFIFIPIWVKPLL